MRLLLWRASIRILSLTLILAPSVPWAATETASLPASPAAAFAQSLLKLSADAEPMVSYFVDSDDWGALRASGQFDFASELNRACSNSQKAPQPLYNKSRNGDGGIVVYRGQIFAEGFFRQHIDQAAFKNANGTLMTRKLINHQPWFEWQASDRSWLYHPSGAEAAILRPFSGPQDFYRGTTVDEWNLIRIYQILSSSEISLPAALELENKLNSAANSRSLHPEMRDFLKKLRLRLPSIRKAPLEERQRDASRLLDQELMELSHHRWDSIFFTTNQRIAQSWAKSALIHWPVNETDLRGFLNNDDLYVGIEFDYVELAAATPASVLNYFTNARLIPKDHYLPAMIDDDSRM